jgi:hypothetical protein
MTLSTIQFHQYILGTKIFPITKFWIGKTSPYYQLSPIGDADFGPGVEQMDAALYSYLSKRFLKAAIRPCARKNRAAPMSGHDVTTAT